MAVIAPEIPYSPPAQQSWFRTHILSTDHKQIGINYLTTSFVFFLAGGLLAMLMRINLAQPGSKFVSPDVYNQLYTMHGTTMIFFAIIPFLVGGFGNFIMPMMIGARDVAFPRLNLASYLLFPPSGILLYLGFLFQGDGGAAQAGWTSYVPVALQSGIGQTFWDLSIIGILASSTLTGINFCVTIVNMRAPGLTWSRLPLFVWAMLVTVVLVLVAGPALIADNAMQLIERLFGAPYFDPAHGGSVLVWQHMFWFYSHPAVYIMILPGFGMVSEIIPIMSRRPIFGYRTIAYSSVAIGFIAFVVWAHHMFASGIKPALQVYFMLATMVIALPTGIKIFSWVATLYGGKIRLNSAMLFTLGFIVTFTLGGISGIMLASVPVDLHEHASYFLVAHIHYVLYAGSMMTVWAGLYMWWPKMTGRMLNETLGKWHFWVTFVSFNLTFFPMHLIGLEGMTRRVATYPEQFAGTNLFISISSFVLGASTLIFVYNAWYSLRYGERAPANPWGARTLDWATPSPAPHGNFAIPPVVRYGPYDFTKPAPYFGPPEEQGAPPPIDERLLRRQGFRKVT